MLKTAVKWCGPCPAALEAVEEAHTDVWEKRWAGDEVTNAKGDRRHRLRDFRINMTSSLLGPPTPSRDWQKYKGVQSSVAFHRTLLNHEIAKAKATCQRRLKIAHLWPSKIAHSAEVTSL